MSSKIHHNTAKKARKFGVELVAVENEFEARRDGRTLACHASASVALEKAIAALEGSDPTKAPRAAKPKKTARKSRDEDESDEPQEGRSIVKQKYKQTYKGRPLKISCSDDLAVQIATHLKVKDEDGKLRIDVAKLKSFARANGCWDPKYAVLNVGQQRMNVVNRLRAKIGRDKHVVVWG